MGDIRVRSVRFSQTDQATLVEVSSLAPAMTCWAQGALSKRNQKNNLNLARQSISKVWVMSSSKICNRVKFRQRTLITSNQMTLSKMMRRKKFRISSLKNGQLRQKLRILLLLRSRSHQLLCQNLQKFRQRRSQFTPLRSRSQKNRINQIL